MSNRMLRVVGAWGTGPFDNDDAADWGIDLDNARAEDRPGMVRSALVLDSRGFVGVYRGEIAVAAAALVAAVLHDEVTESAYWPDFLTNGDSLVLPDDLRSLALAALERVTGPDSELQQLWAESGHNEQWVAHVDDVRAKLHD